MILSENEIVKNLGTNIIIEPFVREDLNPDSYNLANYIRRSKFRINRNTWLYSNIAKTFLYRSACSNHAYYCMI